MERSPNYFIKRKKSKVWMVLSYTTIHGKTTVYSYLLVFKISLERHTENGHPGWLPAME